LKNKFGVLFKHFFIFAVLFILVSGYYFLFLVRFPSCETKRIENIYFNQAKQFANLLSEWVAPDLFLLDQFILQKKLKNAFISNGISRILIFNPQGEIITDTKDTQGKIKNSLYSKALTNKNAVMQKNLLFYEVVVPIYATSEIDNTNINDNILGYLSITYKEPVIGQLNLEKLYQNEGIYLSFIFSLLLYLLFLILLKLTNKKISKTHINNIPEKLNQSGIEAHLMNRIEQDELLNLDVTHEPEAKNLNYKIFLQFEQHFTDLIESFVDLGETVKNLQNIKKVEFPEINVAPITGFIALYNNIYQNLNELNQLPEKLKENQQELSENVTKTIGKMPDLIQTVAILKKISVKLCIEVTKAPENEEIKKVSEEIRLISESLLKQGKILEENISALKDVTNKLGELNLSDNIDLTALPNPDELKETCSIELKNIQETTEKIPFIMGTLKKYVAKLQIFNKEISKKARENLLELNTYKERL
jgi:hypothetical protein